jgi:LysR family glycine cleavage system transcriptional activator
MRRPASTRETGNTSDVMKIPPLNPIEGLRGRGQSQEPHDRNELRVSQSAVSRQIAVLEEYGVQLFTRERIGVN